MFKLFSKEKNKKKDENHLSLISIAALLIHSAKIDENFTSKEKSIIRNALIEMGVDEENLDKIIEDAEQNNEIPPERDLRDTQPTISVNYRIIKENSENEIPFSNETSKRREYQDDWNNNGILN